MEGGGYLVEGRIAHRRHRNDESIVGRGRGGEYAKKSKGGGCCCIMNKLRV